MRDPAKGPLTMITTFTPLQSLAGGGLIGLASVLLMLSVGRIMGATGILAGVLFPTSRADFTWRITLLAGMITAPLIYLAATGALPEMTVPVSTPMLMAGGFIVGLGVTFGGGCTSGHGVCGMARLSPRSITATATFMITCAATVYIIRHIIGA